MNFNGLIDHGKWVSNSVQSIRENKKIVACRCVSRSKGTRISNESTSPVFFGFGNLERLIRRVYGVKLSTIQTSSVTGLFLSFVVRFQRFKNEGFGAKKNIEARKREKKERGIFVIRKSKLRLSRTIAVARVPRDLWFNVLSFADFNSRASNFPSRDFSPRETRFYPALYARERRDITVAFKLEKKKRERGEGGRKIEKWMKEGNEQTRVRERTKNERSNEWRGG